MRLMPYYAKTDRSRPLEANNSSFCAVFAGLYGCLQIGAIDPQFFFKIGTKSKVRMKIIYRTKEREREREREDETSFLT